MFVTAIAQVDWPDSILSSDLCPIVLEEKTPLYLGLRLAIAMNSGPSLTNFSSKTNRYRKIVFWLLNLNTSFRTNFYGSTVDDARTLAGCAFGGQILMTKRVFSNMTKATREQVHQMVISDDLGWYKVHDIPRPVHLFEVIPPNLGNRTFGALPNSTPVEVRTFHAS